MSTTELLPTEALLVSRNREAVGHVAHVNAPWLAPGMPRAMITAAPLVAADLLATLASFTIAWFPTITVWPATALDMVAMGTAFLAAICVANLAAGLYPGIGLTSFAETRRCSVAIVCIGALFLVMSPLQRRLMLPAQLVILATCLTLLVLLPLCRAFVRRVFSRFSWWGQPALIVGRYRTAHSVYHFLDSNPRLGLRPLGIINDGNATDHRAEKPYVLGPLSCAGQLLRDRRPGWLIFAAAEHSRDEVGRLALRLGRTGTHRTVMSWLDGSPSLWTRASHCLDWPGTDERRLPARSLTWIKRVFDVLIAIVVGVLALPVIALIAALIKISSKGPVFFRQQRVGRHNCRFAVYKFRTMTCDGDKVLADYLAACPLRRERWNRDHKLADDPRVTRVGRWLRRTSLDELPQLWNVLRGEMSLVGPRPILAAEIPDFGDSFAAFCSVPPGITGLWQVSGRNQTTYEEHVEMDRYYAENWSLWMDLYILMLTIRVVLFRHGAY